ncbi:MAG: hypothetical protein Fur0037_26680 [Planctomycetota bacterium]
MIAQSWLQDPLEALPERQRAVAIVLAVLLLAAVIELLRRRKLREEYAWLWLGTAGLLLVLAIEQDLILYLSTLIGSATSTSTLFFGGLLFLLAVTLQFSVRLSRLTHRNRILAQRLALLEAEIRKLRRPPEKGDSAAEVRPLREVPPLQERDEPRKGGVA